MCMEQSKPFIDHIYYFPTYINQNQPIVYKGVTLVHGTQLGMNQQDEQLARC